MNLVVKDTSRQMDNGSYEMLSIALFVFKKLITLETNCYLCSMKVDNCDRRIQSTVVSIVIFFGGKNGKEAVK